MSGKVRRHPLRGIVSPRSRKRKPDDRPLNYGLSIQQGHASSYSSQQGYEDAEVGEDPPMDEQPAEPPNGSSRSQRRKQAGRNAAEYSSWKGAFPELVWQRYVYEGSSSRSSRHSRTEQFLHASLKGAVDEQVMYGCKFCTSGADAGPLHPCPKRRLTIVDVLGSVEVGQLMSRATG